MEEKELKKLKQKYSLKEEVLLNVLEIQSKINEKNELSFGELISFLVRIMNDREMQAWRFGRSLNGEIVSLNDSLAKYFKIKTNEEIINLYELNNNVKIKIKK